MKDSRFYIEEIKKFQGVKSDYAVAKLLGIKQNMITHYNNGRSSFDNDIALKVAELSGHDPVEIILNMKATKSKDPATMRKWRALAKRLASTASVVILSLVIVAALPGNVDTATISGFYSAPTLYIMLSCICLLGLFLQPPTAPPYKLNQKKPIHCALFFRAVKP